MLERFTGYKRLLALAALASGGSVVEDTVTGNPVTFLTDLAKPLKSLAIAFTPKQSGTGDPSPENIRPILPWEGLTVFGGGKNLFDKANPNIQNAIILSGEVYATANGRTVTLPCKPNTAYVVSKIATTRSVLGYATTETAPTAGDAVYGVKDWRNKTEETITTGADAKWLVIYIINTNYDETPVANVIDSLQVEVGSTATAYEPYKPITETDIIFYPPVYGGTLDMVTGVLTVEWVAFNANDSDVVQWMNSSQSARSVFEGNIQQARNLDNISNIICNRYKTEQATVRISEMNDLCIKGNNSSNITIYIRDTNYTTLQEFTESLDGVVFCYELATPQTVQLTAEQITAIKGQNILWSDADGNLTVTFLKKG